MPIFYCFNCGAGTNYTLNKPRVCLKCNQSFYQPTTNTTASPKIGVKPIPQLITEPEYSEPEEIPVIDSRSFASAEVQRPGSSFKLSKPVTNDEKQSKLKRQPSKPRSKK